MEISQIFLLDYNLHILFGQEREETIKLAELRELISESLRQNPNKHLVIILFLFFNPF